MARKSAASKKQKSFEQTLWETADKLRGTVESSGYKHVVLSQKRYGTKLYTIQAID